MQKRLLKYKQSIFGQGKLVIFLQKEISLGTLNREEATKKTVCFDYLNKTGEKVVIQKVKTSCGCISVDYPCNPIRPLEKGPLKVLLNLQGIEGVFRESSLVYLEDYSPILLIVTGKNC